MKKLLSFFLSLAVAAGLFTVPAGVSADEQSTNDAVVIDSMDYVDLWQSTGERTVNVTDNMEGFGCLQVSGADIILSAAKSMTVEGGLKAKKNFEMWLYCEDASALTTDSMVVIHRNNSELKLKIPVEKLKNGWNKVDIMLVLALPKHDGIDSIEIKLATGGKAQKFMIDDIVLSPVTEVENTEALKAAVADAKAYDTKYLSGAQAARLEKLLARAEAPVTRRDADAIAADINALIHAPAFDGQITTHGRTYYRWNEAASKNELYMSYSSTGFSVRFYGTELKAKLRGSANAQPAIINIYTDRDTTTFDYDHTITTEAAARAELEKYNQNNPHIQLSGTETEYTLVSGLTEGIHSVTVLKRGEVTYTDRVILSDISTDGQLLAPPARSTRRIEVIGDSNMTGFANLAGGGYSYATQDGTVTFAGYIANGLGADYSLIARSGVTLTPGVAGNCSEGFMYNTYLYTDYWTNGDASGGTWNDAGSNINQEDPSKFNFVSEDKLYDFAEADNDVVVIHIGDNDHDGRNGSVGSNRETFIDYMKKYIRQVRSVNPNAEIIVCFSISGYEAWRDVEEAAVNQIKAEGEDRVCFLRPVSGTFGSSGHPYNKIHYDAAQQVIAKIKELTGWKAAVREVYSDPTAEVRLVPSENYAEIGETVTFKLPDNTDPESVKITTYGKDVEFSKAEDGTVSFTMPDGAVMLHADKKEIVIDYGNVDGDEKVSSTDALWVLQSVVGARELSESQKLAADVNTDGKIDTEDALTILQHVVGIVEKLPVPKE